MRGLLDEHISQHMYGVISVFFPHRGASTTLCYSHSNKLETQARDYTG